MHRKSFYLFLAVLLVIAALPTGRWSMARASDAVTIGMSVPNLDDPFFVSMNNGAQDAADKLGVTLVAMAAANDPATEQANIQALISQGVKAILLSPTDPTAGRASIEAANKAGVPVVLVSKGASIDMTGLQVVASITPFNAQGGWLAGKTLCEALNQTGTVVELVGDPADKAASEQHIGFSLYMTQECPSITVAQLETAGMNHDAISTAFSDLLGSQDVNGVFAYNSDTTLAAVEASIMARKSKIVFVGGEASTDTMSALEQGRVQTIVTPSLILGQKGIETSVDFLNGKKISTNILADFGVVNIDSIAIFRIGCRGSAC